MNETIQVFEFVQQGLSHANFTRAFIEAIAVARPQARFRFHAQQSHLDATTGPLSQLLGDRLSTRPLQPVHPTLKDVARTASILLDACGTGPSRPSLIILLTGQPSLIWAAKLARLRRPGLHIRIVMHGDMAAIRSPSARNPFLRFWGYPTSMARWNHPDLRFLVLEPHIKTATLERLPGLDGFIDAAHHPTLITDPPAVGLPELPLRFGLLGIAGRSKGLDVFARIALKAREAVQQPVQFRLIGKVQPGWQELDLSGIDGPLPFSEDWLPTPDFEAEIARLHYAVLPYNADYYAYAASGVLLDALRWRKPIIAFRNPAITALTEYFGDIGHMCSDEAEMATVVTSLATGFDPARYQAQQQAIGAAYHSRLPTQVAAELAPLLETRT